MLYTAPAILLVLIGLIISSTEQTRIDISYSYKHSCKRGLKLCHNKCVDLKRDTKNCGKCGHKCGYMKECDRGECRYVHRTHGNGCSKTCTPPSTLDKYACTCHCSNPTTVELGDGCDACKTCDTGLTCSTGTCKCTNPTTAELGDSCNDCKTCDTGLTCSSGTCGCADPATVELGGSCDGCNTCDTGLTCSGGTCECANPTTVELGDSCDDCNTCDTGLTCNGGTCECADPTTVGEGQTCNDCNTCSGELVCSGGTCKSQCTSGIIAVCGAGTCISCKSNRGKDQYIQKNPGGNCECRACPSPQTQCATKDGSGETFCCGQGACDTANGKCFDDE